LPSAESSSGKNHHPPFRTKPSGDFSYWLMLL
jgi:hypothetical protein